MIPAHVILSRFHQRRLGVFEERSQRVCKCLLSFIVSCQLCVQFRCCFLSRKVAARISQIGKARPDYARVSNSFLVRKSARSGGRRWTFRLAFQSAGFAGEVGIFLAWVGLSYAFSRLSIRSSRKRTEASSCVGGFAGPYGADIAGSALLLTPCDVSIAAEVWLWSRFETSKSLIFSCLCRNIDTVRARTSGITES